MDVQRMKRKLEGYAAVSFDIFDTLLKRDVWRPSDVFELVEREYRRRCGRESQFAAARVAAQDQAREQLRRFLAPNTGYQPSTVRMFHE